MLAVFAVVDLRARDQPHGTFPASVGQARGVIGLAAVLVLAAMAAAIITG